MIWRARLVEEDFGRTARLQVARVGSATSTLVMPDGVLQQIEEGAAYPDNYGLILPGDPECLKAIAEVFLPFAPHKVEVKRLEEALALERNRVDQIIDRALEH